MPHDVLPTAIVSAVGFRTTINRVLLPAMVFGLASFTMAMYAAPYVITWLRRMKWGLWFGERARRRTASRSALPSWAG